MSSPTGRPAAAHAVVRTSAQPMRSINLPLTTRKYAMPPGLYLHGIMIVRAWLGTKHYRQSKSAQRLIDGRNNRGRMRSAPIASGAGSAYWASQSCKPTREDHWSGVSALHQRRSRVYVETHSVEGSSVSARVAAGCVAVISRCSRRTRASSRSAGSPA